MFSAAQQLKKIYENTANYCNPSGEKTTSGKKGSRKACTEKNVFSNTTFWQNVDKQRRLGLYKKYSFKVPTRLSKGERTEHYANEESNVPWADQLFFPSILGCIFSLQEKKKEFEDKNDIEQISCSHLLNEAISDNTRAATLHCFLLESTHCSDNCMKVPHTQKKHEIHTTLLATLLARRFKNLQKLIGKLSNETFLSDFPTIVCG